MSEDKNKTYDFEIENFTEEDLYEEELTAEEIVKLKKRMIKTVRLLKNLNKELNIDMDLEDALKIRKELGEESEVIEHGVINALLLRKIVLDAIDIEVKKQNLEIIDELFVPTQIAIPGRVDTVMLHGCTYFYKMYLTNNSLIVYSLSDKYQVIKKKTFQFNELHSVGKAIKSKRLWSKGLAVFANTYNGNQSFIEPHDRTTMYLNHTKKEYKEQVLRFLDKLSEVGKISIVTEERLDKTDYLTIASYIMLFIFFICIIGKIVFKF